MIKIIRPSLLDYTKKLVLLLPLGGVVLVFTVFSWLIIKGIFEIPFGKSSVILALLWAVMLIIFWLSAMLLIIQWRKAYKMFQSKICIWENEITFIGYKEDEFIGKWFERRYSILSQTLSLKNIHSITAEKKNIIGVRRVEYIPQRVTVKRYFDLKFLWGNWKSIHRINSRDTLFWMWQLRSVCLFLATNNHIPCVWLNIFAKDIEEGEDV